MNAANEIAVAAFLEGKIGFCDIYRVNALTLEHSELSVLESVESIMETDRTARHRAQQIIATLR